MNSSLTFPTSYNETYTIAFNSIFNSIFILIFGLPLNVYVVWLITTGAGSGVVPEIFALNLSVCETIACFKTVPATLFVLYRHEINVYLNYAVTFLSTVLGVGRPLFQCCVCVERYVAVVYPVVFLKFKSLKYRVISSAAVWLIMLGISACAPIPSVRITLYYILLPLYLFLLCIKMFCSIAVLKALRRPGPGEKWSAKDAEANRMKKKAFWVILIILVAMILTYGPLIMYIILYDSLSVHQQWDGTTVYSYIMTLCGLVQPLLYLHRTGKLPFLQCF